MSQTNSLVYVMKAHLHTHKGVQRRNSRKGAQIILCWATPSPITGTISLSKANLHKPREAQGLKGKQEQKLRTRRKKHPVQAPSRAVPGDPQIHGPSETPIKMSEHYNTFQAGWVLLPTGWDTLLDCTRINF